MRPHGCANFKRRVHLLAAIALSCILQHVDGALSAQGFTGKPGAVTAAPRTAELSYPQLVDITASTGIHFDHVTSPEQKYLVESMSGGVALIDYDRDGWPDIYFTNAQTVDMALHGQKSRSALFHNNRDGTFTDVTDQAGVGYPCWAMGAVVGDYNNDGWPDLLVTCVNGVVLFRNNGDGTFTDVTRSVGLASDHYVATGAAFGDYNGDGWDDLFISHYIDFQIDKLPPFGGSGNCHYLGVEIQCGPRGLQGAPDNLYRNTGHAIFTDVSDFSGVGDQDGRYGLTAVWSNFNNDGRLDLLVANDRGPNYLYKADPSGTFQDLGLASGVALNANGAAQANMGVAIGDYLHTGRGGIFISHFDDEYAELFRNDGDMIFTDVSGISGVGAGTSGYVGWGDAFVDFSNDGWLDIFVVNGHAFPQIDVRPDGPRYHEPKLLFLNERDGKFRNISRLVGPAIQKLQVSRGMAIGDLFNDGRMEAVVENLSGEPMILRPENGPPNHWISFELEGVTANRLALNARVVTKAGDLVQSAEVLSGGSYLSQNDLRLHFGMAGHRTLDRAEVFWPDGRVDILRNLISDRFYTVREGAGIVSSVTPNK